MQRIHRASFIIPHEPYRLAKHFRREEEFGYKRVKWHKSIYNKDLGQVFGSTPMRWLTRLIFFICLYSAICLLWFICWIVFKVTLTENEPNNYVHAAPGMSLAPHLHHLIYPIIEFRDKKDIDIDAYTQDIDHFLSKYGELNEDFGECTADKEYGYMERKPCFFIKLNRIIGFKPKTYDSAAELPKSAPETLKALIRNLTEEEKKNRVWLSCEAQRKGETKLEYWPKHQSVPAELLTVTKTEKHGDSFYTPKDYKRIVAVQISGFNISEKFNVQCLTWAKNIPQLKDGYGNRGYLKFSIHVKRGLLFSYD